MHFPKRDLIRSNFTNLWNKLKLLFSKLSILNSYASAIVVECKIKVCLVISLFLYILRIKINMTFMTLIRYIKTDEPITDSLDKSNNRSKHKPKDEEDDILD